MIRRSFLLSGSAFVVVAAASLAGWGNAGLSAARLPWTPTASARLTAAPDEPSPPGGLGNRRADLERVYGPPTGLRGTMLAYQNGAFAAGYRGDRATSLLLSFRPAHLSPLAAARQRVRSLLPPDSRLIGTMGAGPNRTADVYASHRLARKLGADAPTGEPNGRFVVIYQTDRAGNAESVLLNVGGIPTKPRNSSA